MNTLCKGPNMRYCITKPCRRHNSNNRSKNTLSSCFWVLMKCTLPRASKFFSSPEKPFACWIAKSLPSWHSSFKQLDIWISGSGRKTAVSGVKIVQISSASMWFHLCTYATMVCWYQVGSEVGNNSDAYSNLLLSIRSLDSMSKAHLILCFKAQKLYLSKWVTEQSKIGIF